MAARNPFIVSYTGIFNTLNNFKPWQDLAEIVSMIKVVGEEERHVNSNQRGDVPALRLGLGGGTWNVPGSSSGSQAVRIYPLEYVSGEIDATLSMDIEFQIGRALATAIERGLLDLDFIEELRLTEFSNDNDNTELQQGIQGWTGTLQIEATLGIANSCMIEGG